MPPTNRIIDTKLVEYSRQLRSELGKAAIFFGITGVLIGLVHLSEFRILGGSGGGARLSDDLLGDYLSFTALLFQMLGCMLMGGLVGLMRSVAPLRRALLDLYDHVRLRLLQVASPMICISIGIALTSITHFFKTGRGHGLELAALLVVFVLLVVITYLVPTLLDPRADWPAVRGQQWVVPMLTVALSLAGLLFLIVAIPAQRRHEATGDANACDQTTRPARRYRVPNSTCAAIAAMPSGRSSSTDSWNCSGNASGACA